MTYIKEAKNEECNNAIRRLFLNINININKINKFIDDAEGISKIRKEFYKKIIAIRYKMLKDVYRYIK